MLSSIALLIPTLTDFISLDQESFAAKPIDDRRNEMSSAKKI